MALTRATIGWHVGSLAAGGLAVFSAMASQQVDVYAIWKAMNTVVADVTALLAALAPVAAIFGAAYRTWNAKQVPTAAVAVVPTAVDPAPEAGHAIVTGKVVGALLLGLLLLAPYSAFAQQNVAPLVANNCDPQTIFKGLTPQNFVPRIKACGDEDLTNAIADANSAPIDNAALACLTPLQTIKSALNKNGLLTAFQGFRRAKNAGLITSCINYVNSTVLLQ